MRPIPIGRLAEWIWQEHAQEGVIFGIPEARFHKSRGDGRGLFGRAVETPVGPAAGPHTQLAQNLISAYLAGGRFFELKTVQTLDGEDLPVSKPCILAKDEGYNVEWSTELRVEQAMDEYIKAYLLISVLAEELSLGRREGFAFNMSVGYDLAGIKSAKIDMFIEGLKDASGTEVWRQGKAYLLSIAGRFTRVNKAYIEGISPSICSSITLSTLHGCPPEAIESIASYLLTEKKLHTYIKCNPTLLGYEFTRSALDRTGYDHISFDRHHFKNDLQLSDAVPMFKRLSALAKAQRLGFGLKLSNTLPVQIFRGELPGDEMYMSGKALYPLTINLAARLARATDGGIRISYSGGADAFNIEDILRAGVWPVTVETTLLKPGGYLRMTQLAQQVQEAQIPERIDLERLERLAQTALADARYAKAPEEKHKTGAPLPLMDCFIAPCKTGCPIGQDIPEYIRLVREGRYTEAFETIAAKNPLPFTTGAICHHPCELRCNRIDCDGAVDIRGAKLEAALRGYEAWLCKAQPCQPTGCKVGVIGAGPAGIAAGVFLARDGFDVTVFDKRERAGGIVSHVIPDFRIQEEYIERDIELARRTGVKFVLGTDGEVTAETLRRQGYQYIFVAAGAWQPGCLELEPADKKAINVLDFLAQYKQKKGKLKIGRTVAVIGGGNSAIDAARAAKRVPGVQRVCLIYRRTRSLMPADCEEIESALEEGVELHELLSPVSCLGGALKCQRMILGAPDESGRHSPVPVKGVCVEFDADTVIAAVGERADSALLNKLGVLCDAKGKPVVDPDTNETGVPGVYIGGDALRGPSSVVEAIADAVKFADAVIKKEKGAVPDRNVHPRFNREAQLQDIMGKRGVMQDGTVQPRACLECGEVCNLCVEVCPNRANVAVRADGLRCVNQVVHMDGMCNECGNCATFCPYEGAPYRDKLTIFWSCADFADSENPGLVVTDAEAGKARLRLGGTVCEISLKGDAYPRVPADIARLIRTIRGNYGWLLLQEQRREEA
jgi:putative selenate reductase